MSKKLRVSVSVALTLAVVVLTGCTTIRKRAANHFQTGDYEQAVVVYDQILAEDPNDSESAALRAKAREKWIDQKLITVRSSRLAGNHQNSIDLLLNIVLKENQWSAFPKGAVAYTQDEEAGEALVYLRRSVQTALQKRFPLKGQALVVKYRPIFAGPLAGALEAVTTQVRVEGNKSCLALNVSAQPTTPYYAHFLRKYCAIWNDKVHVARDEDRRSDELYGSLNARAGLEGVPEETAALFAGAMQTAFTETPWYDDKGKRPASASVSGRFVMTNSQQPETRAHEYTVQIPYTEYVPVTKWRQIPYAAYDRQCYLDPNSGSQICNDLSTTKYRSESYVENEAQTRYRTEPRTQMYDGISLYRRLDLLASGSLKFGGSVSTPLSLVDKSETNGFHHDWNMPTIGLHPQRANLQDPDEWLKSQAGALAKTVSAQGKALWERLYCRPLAMHSAAPTLANQVHRCARLKASPAPALIANWYRDVMGVTIEEAELVIGLGDY